LFNNTNSGGALNHAPNPAFFTLVAPANITEIDTYHWNNGQGAVPGTIALRHQSGQVFGPFPARGTSGAWGAQNVNWVAQVSITIPGGSYIVLDSSPATWSYNPQSGNRGFAIVRGSYLPPIPKPVSHPAPPPPPPPTGGMGGFQPCAPSTYGAAVEGPCVRTPGVDALTVVLKRAVPSAPYSLTFRTVLTNGVPAAVSGVGLGGSGSSLTTGALPIQLCATGTNGKWNVWLYNSAGQSWGVIGQLTVDCRRYGR
ncbi:MAG: hypothetical protein ACHP79_13390, partial [Terriglobales bacterium]